MPFNPLRLTRLVDLNVDVAREASQDFGVGRRLQIAFFRWNIVSHPLFLGGGGLVLEQADQVHAGEIRFVIRRRHANRLRPRFGRRPARFSLSGWNVRFFGVGSLRCFVGGGPARGRQSRDALAGSGDFDRLEKLGRIKRDLDWLSDDPPLEACSSRAKCLTSSR